jgi:hypothetical protein
MYPTPHGWAIAETVLGVALVVASIVVYRRRTAPPWWVSVVTAAVVRLVVVVIARGHTPTDVGHVFAWVARLTLAHQDALTKLPRHFWNFVPLMAYVLAGEWRTSIPWELAVKIVPVLADLATVVFVGLLVRDSSMRARNVQLLYALSPIAVFVTAHHGQVEPVAAMLGVVALCLAQRANATGAGVFLGLAVACKTWPVVFAPGVLRELPRRRWPVTLAIASAIVALLFSTVSWVLHDSLRTAAHIIASYRSYVGTYGWSGLLHLHGSAGAGYNGPNIDSYQVVGTVLTLVTVVALLVLFRHLDGVQLTAVLLLGVLAVAAGFGGQYLLWPVAALLAAPGVSRRGGYLLAASAFIIFWYFVALPAPPPHAPGEIRGVDVAQVWLSLPVIAAALAAIPWERARRVSRGWSYRT